MGSRKLSLGEARRIALAAQGFDKPRPAGLAGIRRTLQQVGLLQLDFVNVLAPAHYMVLFSRLGPYDRAKLDELVYRRREFTEQWAHEASIVPVDAWPLLAHRRETHRVRPWGFEKFLDTNPEYVARLHEEVRRRGPVTAEEMPGPDGAPRRIPGAWVGTVPRATLEALFGRGELAVAGRRPNFAREYDLAERVIPGAHYRKALSPAEAQRELVRRAARAHGVGTALDLADYFRMPIREAKVRIAELMESGEIAEVRVEGWKETAYLHKHARSPGRVDAAALLAPFDPLVWCRPRVQRLFGFEYRVEIYVPAEKRRWGYYVLPFLLGEKLVARADLRADRAKGVLQLRSVHFEKTVDRQACRDALWTELKDLAEWLELEPPKKGRNRRGG